MIDDVELHEVDANNGRTLTLVHVHHILANPRRLLPVLGWLSLAHDGESILVNLFDDLEIRGDDTRGKKRRSYRSQLPSE